MSRRSLARHLDQSARLARRVGLVVCYRHIEAEVSARRGREDRQLVGRELVSGLERDRHRSLAGVGRVVAAVDVVEGMESAKGEGRRSLGVEEEESSSWAEEDIGLEAGCSWVGEDSGFAGVGCSVAAVDSLADLLDGRRRRLHHSNLDSTYRLCL